MNTKASGRAALILAAGLLLWVAGPLQAAEDADGGATASKPEIAAGPPGALSKFTSHRSRHGKIASSHRKSVKVASRTSTKASKKQAVDAEIALKDSDDQPALPPSIANANAQLAAADVPADNAGSVSSQASNMLRTMAARQGDSAAFPQPPAPAAEAEVVAADQLNDVDRALSESKSEEKPAAAPAAAPAMVQAPAVSRAPAVAGSSETAWDQTSLVGKIFIAFGGLLTLASAARMFMA
ncbi:hypothetical protein [uncultured Bradyrhizobium sp.]|uniref:hypothetical protein n=1 Tax=uncultured Bradyrhizobium sp. TaxID=199684 RepID=UPI0035CA9F20